MSLLLTRHLFRCRLSHRPILSFSLFFFFNDTATTEIYTLSLHDALPIFVRDRKGEYKDLLEELRQEGFTRVKVDGEQRDRKSTRLNSSHTVISYAVFCLKKKTKNQNGRLLSQRDKTEYAPASAHSARHAD